MAGYPNLKSFLMQNMPRMKQQHAAVLALTLPLASDGVVNFEDDYSARFSPQILAIYARWRAGIVEAVFKAELTMEAARALGFVPTDDELVEIDPIKRAIRDVREGRS